MAQTDHPLKTLDRPSEAAGPTGDPQAELHGEVPPVVAPPPGHRRFGLFDALRAIAALMILVYHSAGAVGAIYAGRTGVITQHLDSGITVFFLISGFLIYRPFVAARESRRPPARLRDFFRRRALRIVPAYWLALTVAALVQGGSDFGSNFWGHWWAYYGFGQVYSMSTVNDGMFAAWTLDVEVSFYLLLPLYAAAVGVVARTRPTLKGRVRVELACLLILVLASLVARAWVFGTPDRLNSHLNLSFTIATTFTWFALGMALAVVSVAAEQGRRARLTTTLARHSSLTYAAAAAVLVAVAVVNREGLIRQGLGLAASELWLHLGYGLMAALLLIPAVFELDGRGAPRRLLRWKTLAWLGVISYGLYLWQQVVISQVGNWGAFRALILAHPLVPMVVASGLLVVAGAATSYYLVESPLLRFKDRRPSLRPRGATGPASGSEG